MAEPRRITFDDLVGIVSEKGAKARAVTAIAGAPGSGKSTLSEALAAELNKRAPSSAAVFPMDGYHFDDRILEERGQLPRKGAPFTFDVAGFGHMLARLRANTEDDIAVPVFDRSIEIARNAARIIPRSVRHLIVEGNYLMLDQQPWSALLSDYDLSVFLEVPEDVLRARLLERWSALEGEALRVKMDENDLPNALLVARESRGAEFVIENA